MARGSRRPLGGPGTGERGTATGGDRAVPGRRAPHGPARPPGDPDERASRRSDSKAARGLVRLRSASTPIARSVETRAASACSSWATVRSRAATRRVGGVLPAHRPGPGPARSGGPCGRARPASPNSSAIRSARERPSTRSPAFAVPAGETTDQPRPVRVRVTGGSAGLPATGGASSSCRSRRPPPGAGPAGRIGGRRDRGHGPLRGDHAPSRAGVRGSRAVTPPAAGPAATSPGRCWGWSGRCRRGTRAWARSGSRRWPA